MKSSLQCDRKLNGQIGNQLWLMYSICKHMYVTHTVALQLLRHPFLLHSDGFVVILELAAE